MPASGHKHSLAPVAWTTRPVMPPCGHFISDEVVGTGDNIHFDPEVVRCPHFADHPARPAVLLGCIKGICATTETVMPKKRSRAVPEGITPEQFQALKAGQYWPEIVT